MRVEEVMDGENSERGKLRKKEAVYTSFILNVNGLYIAVRRIKISLQKNLIVGLILQAKTDLIVLWRVTELRLINQFFCYGTVKEFTDFESIIFPPLFDFIFKLYNKSKKLKKTISPGLF